LLKVKIKNEFKNKTILITGGTGSIGIGLINQLLRFKPNAIRILTNDENSIFETKQRFAKFKNFTYLLGDIRDKDRLRLALRNVDIVFHAAAVKHVDICEENPFDAVKTNVMGTSNILEESLLANISKFILISTDKAANPTTTLGASKLLAERLTLNASSYRGKGKTRFAIVRFGNVIGSRGSVFQIFYDQIKNSKPITVTDSKMTRFIMSISDAALMILKVTNIMSDKEIYILKMPSVKILDLAKQMQKILSEKLKSNSKIKISRLREYEKMSEDLIASQELEYCHDIDGMYKITAEKISKQKALQFNSSKVKTISEKELSRVIKEVLDDYSMF